MTAYNLHIFACFMPLTVFFPNSTKIILVLLDIIFSLLYKKVTTEAVLGVLTKETRSQTAGVSKIWCV